MIGTSAGAIVAADVQLGRGLDQLLEPAESDLAGGPRGDVVRTWRSTPDLLRRLIGSSWIMARSALPTSMRTPETPPLLQRAFPGSLLRITNRDWARDRFPIDWSTGDFLDLVIAATGAAKGA